MKNKFLILLSLIISSVNSYSQNTNSVVNTITIKDSLRIKNKWITTISDDTTFTNSNFSTIPTQKAIKSYIDNNIGSSFYVTDGTLNSNRTVTMNNNSLAFLNGNPPNNNYGLLQLIPYNSSFLYNLVTNAYSSDNVSGYAFFHRALPFGSSFFQAEQNISSGITQRSATLNINTNPVPALSIFPGVALSYYNIIEKNHNSTVIDSNGIRLSVYNGVNNPTETSTADIDQNSANMFITKSGFFFYNINEITPAIHNILVLDTSGAIQLSKFQNNVNGDSILTTDVNGNLKLISNVTKKITHTTNNNYTITNTDYTIICDAATALRTISLPTTTINGRIIIIVVRGDLNNWQTNINYKISDISQTALSAFQTLQYDSSENSWVLIAQ